jgi:ABC-type sugar transport system ATPase subunit
MSQVAVEAVGIGKRFGGVPALRDVDLTINLGEVHALVGANGAGKSTLGKILGGYYARDDGEIVVFGEGKSQWSVSRASQCGVAMIHQEIQLVPELSVADNVFLGVERQWCGFTLPNRRRYRDLDAKVGFGIPPDIAAALPLAARQKVEILRALARDARVLIMDEPTAALGGDETDKLHAVMRRLAGEGRSIVYVTHFLDHVLAQCDKVTVLRDGQVTASQTVGSLNKAALVELMLGRAFSATFPSLPPVPAGAETMLKVENLSAGKAVRSASLEVRQGEVVGLLGLMGSGRSELLRALFGVDRRGAGAVTFGGAPWRAANPKAAIDQGLVMVPEDRRGQGLVMTGTVGANMTLPYLRRFSWLGLLKRQPERAAVSDFIRQFEIAPAGAQTSIQTCSGGNQQKVLLARWLLGQPKLILLDEPTRGVDIGARQKIYDLIADMARAGMAVVLVSSDLEEVLGLSHRCYLMADGRTVAEVDPAGITADQALSALFHTQVPRTQALGATPQ